MVVVMSTSSQSSAILNPLSYAPRQCKFLGLGSAGDVTYKLYFIWSNKFSTDDLPSLSQLHKVVASGLQGWSLVTDHPLAFAIIHFANDGLYLLISRWNNANNIRHRVFSIKIVADQLTLQPLEDAWTIACIWEMRLIKHEVDFWVNTILCADEPTLSPQITHNYLLQHFEGML